MFFDANSYAKGVGEYATTLKSFLQFSIMRGFVLGMQGDYSNPDNIATPKILKSWRDFIPTSVGGWLWKWCLAPPLLFLLLCYCALTMTIKTALWCVVLAIVIVAGFCIQLRFSKAG